MKISAFKQALFFFSYLELTGGGLKSVFSRFFSSKKDLSLSVSQLQKINRRLLLHILDLWIKPSLPKEIGSDRIGLRAELTNIREHA